MCFLQMHRRKQKTTSVICFCRLKKKSPASVLNWSVKPERRNRNLQKNAISSSRKKKISIVLKLIVSASRKRSRDVSRMLLNSRQEPGTTSSVRRLSWRKYQVLQLQMPEAWCLTKQSVNTHMIWP